MQSISKDDDQGLFFELYSFDNSAATEPNEDFESIVEIACEIAKTPIAYICLVGSGKVWSKSLTENPDKHLPFFLHAISAEEPLIVPDTKNDYRFQRLHTISGGEDIQFFAGFPLITPHGNELGSLCVADYGQNKLDERQIRILKDLAKRVIKILELSKSNEQLKSLNKKIKTKQSALKKLVQHQEKVMAILAHDTRGPLVFIKEMLQMIKNNHISLLEAPELYELMESQIGITLSLIDNLTYWGVARLEDDNNPLELTDLSSLVEYAFSPYYQAAVKKGIVFNNDIKQGSFSTLHKEIVSFILRNLFNNSVKYTEQGSITVEGKLKKRYFEIVVKDTGIGIPKSMLNYLFITKFDSRLGTQGEQGSGLGLMLIFDFVEQLNGYIEAESTEGIGTIIKVGIPVE